MPEITSLPGATFRPEPPRALFSAPDININLPGPDYDVSPRGDRFLIAVVNPEAPAHEIHVVLNWFEELKAGNSRRGPNGTPTAQNATLLTVAQRFERF